jgi:hypothetical protein
VNGRNLATVLDELEMDLTSIKEITDDESGW